MRQSFKMAIKNIMSNKMRSFLTMLGIIIGVASVIILVGLVEGQMNYIRASFSDMGTNQLQVQLTNTPTRSVSPQDLYAFYDKNRAYFKEMSPQVSVKATIKHKTDKLTRAVLRHRCEKAGSRPVYPVFGYRIQTVSLCAWVLYRHAPVWEC